MLGNAIALVLAIKSTRSENIYEGEQEAATNHKYYRRFEMAVSNFKFPFYDQRRDSDSTYSTVCSKKIRNCNATSRVTFNHITEEREISIYDEYDADVGIHLFHTEVWREPPNIHSVFSSQNVLKVEIVLHSNYDKYRKTILNKTYENIIVLYQDVEKKIWIDYTKNETTFKLNNEMDTFGIYGYAGINCEYDCVKDLNSIECNGDIYDQTCEDSEPSNCSSSSSLLTIRFYMSKKRRSM
ncbi:hypothetical protein RF11_02056 [Thelohanellus kitauei]|uniref:Uncharacterized protein n=1 Tax=Thelohanellus kitauei TaxID=669202 RepID=A0A0C2MXQ4_THEKT|nr:hypothetical protein RF11_02056 [Thelohanellus kitauei]